MLKNGGEIGICQTAHFSAEDQKAGRYLPGSALHASYKRLHEVAVCSESNYYRQCSTLNFGVAPFGPFNRRVGLQRMALCASHYPDHFEAR